MTTLSWSPAAGTPAALAILHETKRQVEGALSASVRQLDERVRRIVSYHFGWTTAEGTPAAGGGGKMLRAALVLQCAQAAGGSPELALPGAVAVELTHNGTLLEDDVMDRDECRRHRPASWTVFGESPALLASDALTVLALGMLVREAGTRGAEAAGVLADAYQRLVAGQLMDIDFESRTNVTLAECYRMVEGKTAALTSGAARIGAVLAGADPATVTAFGEFGHHLGLAFQFTDDVLGIWGDPALTGKPVGSDIGTRKKSLPVAFALSLPEWPEAVGPETVGPETVGNVTAFYERGDEPGLDEIGQVTAWLEASGARAWAEARAEHHVEVACECLARAGLAEQDQVALRALAHLATRRAS